MHFVNRQPQVEILRDSKSSDLSPLITEEGGGIQPLYCAHLSIEMQTTILLDRKRPKMRKNEQTRQRISPAHHETVIAQMISRGIMKKVT